MCLTVPLKVKEVNGLKAKLSDGREVNVALINDLKIGDWVLANADLAVSRISEKEAEEINNIFKNKR